MQIDRFNSHTCFKYSVSENVRNLDTRKLEEGNRFSKNVFCMLFAYISASNDYLVIYLFVLDRKNLNLFKKIDSNFIVHKIFQKLFVIYFLNL